MGPTLLPAFAVAAALLVLAGAAKVRRPEGVEATFYALGWGVPPAAVRAFGIAEAALGAVCLAAPDPALALVLAAVYAAFAAVALRLRAAGVACGCFGADGPPASALHVALDVAAALIAAAAALAGPEALPALLGRPALEAGPALLAIGAATYAGYLTFTALPRLWGAWLASEAA